MLGGKPSTVLHIITGLNTGGTERMLYKVLSKTAQDVNRHVVISLLDKGSIGEEIESLGVQVYPLNLKKNFLTGRWLFRLYKLVKSIQPDYIQGWLYHGNLVASLAHGLARSSKKHYWNIRSTLDDDKQNPVLPWRVIRLSKWLSFFPNKILYNSQKSCRQHEAMGFNSKKSLVVPNGFDCESLYSDRLQGATIKQALGIEHHPVIGLVARFDPMKDHYTFLQAAAILHQKNPNVRFVLAGRDVSPTNSELMRWVEQFSLHQVVHLLGERKDIFELNNSFDIAALSSWSEGFPNTVGEAMTCGVPCVVTNVGDMPDVVGDTGIVVPIKDSQALADAWQQLLAVSSETRDKLGQAARERIEHCFSLDVIVDRYRALYQEVVG